MGSQGVGHDWSKLAAAAAAAAAGNQALVLTCFPLGLQPLQGAAAAMAGRGAWGAVPVWESEGRMKGQVKIIIHILDTSLVLTAYPVLYMHHLILSHGLFIFKF